MSTDSFKNNLVNMQSPLFNFAMLLTGNRDNAYDLVQDTTLKALDSEDKFAEGTNFKGWLFTIMRNIFINNYRRTVYEATKVDTTDNLYHLNISQASGLEAPEGSVATIEITQLIQQLPEELYRPFTLFVAGYKYCEISEKLNAPMGTIKTHIFQARKRLQHLLIDYR